MPIAVKAKDAMDNNLVFVEVSETVLKALEKMVQKDVRSAVVENEGLPIGVVTYLDVIRRCVIKRKDPNRVRVGDIVSSPIVTIDPDSPLGDTMKIMVDRGIKRVYVVKGGKIIGRVTEPGVFKEMLNVVLTLGQL